MVTKHLYKEDEQRLLNRHLNTLYAIGLTDYRQMLTSQEKADIQSMISMLKKYASKTDREERALAAIVLHQYGEEKQATSLMNRLRGLCDSYRHKQCTAEARCAGHCGSLRHLYHSARTA